MEASNDANATQLPSSLPSLEPLTIHDDQQPTATHNLQEQTVGIMEDQQPRVVYHIEADGEGEAEDIHIVRNSNNTIDFFAGIQHPEVDVNSIESENEGEIQELDMGDVSPVQCDSNVGDDIQEDVTTTNNSLPLTNATEVAVDISGNPHQLIIPVDKAYHDVNDEERGIFVDFDGDADVDDDEEMSIQEQDNEIEEDVGTGLGFDAVTSLHFYDIKAVTCSQTSEIIAKHLSMPNPQSFESLESLLSSHNAPGRGLYNIEKALEHEDGRISELEEKIQYIQAELEETRARRHRADDIARKARATFSQTHIRAGISNQLWAEYEAFCESLEPKFGNRGGWSITCYEDHKGSYLQWDPDLGLFLESAEMHLGSCNFRCEATAIKSKESTEYVVEFWPLASPEPEVGRTGAAKTWKQQYVSSELRVLCFTLYLLTPAVLARTLPNCHRGGKQLN